MSKSYVVIKNHKKIIAREETKKLATARAVLALAKHPAAIYEVAKVSKRVWTELTPAFRTPKQEDVNGEP